VKRLSDVENHLRKVLLEAVDDGLQLILGDSGRKATYFHLQNVCSLMREDIPNNPSVFVLGLEKIFGGGAKVIEESIVKTFYCKLGIKYEEKKTATFADRLHDAIEMYKKRQG